MPQVPTSYGVPDSSSFGGSSGPFAEPVGSFGGNDLGGGDLSTSYGVPGGTPPGTFGVPISGCCGTPPPNIAPPEPSQSYGVPQNSHGVPQNNHAVDHTVSGLTYGLPSGKTVEGPHHIQPKEPIKFIQPVPTGLLEAIGQSAEYKDTGIGRPYQGGTYIPPSVPETTKPVNEENNENHIEPQGHFGGQGGGRDSGDGFQITQSLSVDLSPPPNGGIHSLDSYGSQSEVGGNLAQAIGGNNQFSYTAYNQGNSFGATGLEGTSQGAVSYQNMNLIPEGGPSGGEAVPEVNQVIKSLGLEGNSITQSQSLDLGLLGNHQGGHYITQPIGNGVQNIPIQGNHGSYTLQIQPAGGVGSTGEQSISHNQVLSNGLLQDILAAIEQQQPPNQQQGLQQLYGQADQIQHAASNAFYQYQGSGDSETQASSVNEQIVNATADAQDSKVPPCANSTIYGGRKRELSDQERFTTLLAQNGVALYYNSDRRSNKTQQEDTESQNESPELNLLDSNQPDAGSYVVFKSPDVKYKYGAVSDDLSNDQQESSSTTQTSQPKDLT